MVSVGVAIGQAATPSASDIACLAKALADACARLPELRAGAEARAASLRTFFAPERPVRETFALLQQCLVVRSMIQHPGRAVAGRWRLRFLLMLFL